MLDNSVEEILKPVLNVLIDKLTKDFEQIPITAAEVKSEFDHLKHLRAINSTSSELLSSLTTLQEHVRQHEENEPVLIELSKEIAKALTSFDEFKKENQQDGSPPLLTAVGKNDLDFVKALIAMGVNVEATSKAGFTALTGAAMLGFEDIAKVLLEHGANVTQQAIEKAVINRHQNILDCFNVNSEQIDKIITKRQLEIGFGVFKLTHTREYEGMYSEGFNFISEYFNRFALHDGSDLLKPIAERFRVEKEYKQDEIMERLQKNGTVLFATGYIGHLIGLSLDKMDDHYYKLTLAERGASARRFPSELMVNNKINSLQNILIPKDKISETLDLLLKTMKLNRQEAETILFDDIETLAKSKWTYNTDSWQARFKAGICFYANPKSLLFHELLKAYSPDVTLAKKCYKEFSLFLHKELLKEYKVCADKDDPYLSICEKIIKEEEVKFFTTFNEPEISIPEKLYANNNKNLLFSLNSKASDCNDDLSEEEEEVYISKPRK